MKDVITIAAPSRGVNIGKLPKHLTPIEKAHQKPLRRKAPFFTKLSVPDSG